MVSFIWPNTSHDIALTREAAANLPNNPQDWKAEAETLNKDFSTPDKLVELTGRIKFVVSKCRAEDASSSWLQRILLHITIITLNFLLKHMMTGSIGTFFTAVVEICKRES